MSRQKLYVGMVVCVFAITERRDMGLYEVPLSLLGFGMWTMLAIYVVLCC